MTDDDLGGRYFDQDPAEPQQINRANEPEQADLHRDRTRVEATRANAEILAVEKRSWAWRVGSMLADLRGIFRRPNTRHFDQDRGLPPLAVRNEGLATVADEAQKYVVLAADRRGRLIVQAQADRPSSAPGRTYKKMLKQDTAGSSQIGTITSGKTLFITGLFVAAINTDNNIGVWRIRTGGVAGEVLFEGLLPGVSVGQRAAVVSEHFNFGEPIQATGSDLYIEIAAGNVRNAASVSGYEE